MLLQDALLPPETEIFHAISEGFAAGSVGILYQFLQRFLLHEPDLPFIGDPECRIQADFIEVVPQQKEAEAVDGGNLGIV